MNYLSFDVLLDMTLLLGVAQVVVVFWIAFWVILWLAIDYLTGYFQNLRRPDPYRHLTKPRDRYDHPGMQAKKRLGWKFFQ